MWNIFIVVFFMTLSLAFFNPYFFIGYLIGIAFFGLYQAIFMANAGGAWDNAKKIVEVDLKEKNTPPVWPAGHGDRRDHAVADRENGHRFDFLPHRTHLHLPVFL